MVRHFVNLQGKTVLVVGGSGVLGGALVRALSARGATVLATCRTAESADRIPAEAQLRLLADLESPESIRVLTAYLNQSQPIDGVVIASGLVGFGGAEQTSLESAARLAQVNYLGPAQLISELLGNLKKSSQPFVAAITGVVAEKVFPGMNAYTASKTAFAAWLSSLRLEQRGIQVLDARPGHTETGLANRAIFGVAPNFPTGMTPEHVTTRIIEALEAGETILESGRFV